MEILPGIHHFNTDPFNWYLLKEGRGLTVVDAGFPGHYRTFREGLSTIGSNLRDVQAIVVTHAHADHMGFAERLRRETKAPVFIHAADGDSASRPRQLPWWGLLSNAWRPYMAQTLAKATLHGVFWAPGIAKYHPIRDGETLDVPGRPRVLHVPGHTPGQVALHLPSQGVLLSSDVLITRNLLTGTQGTPQLAAAALNAHDPQARRNLDRLAELGRVALLPGHGKPWNGQILEAIHLARRPR